MACFAVGDIQGCFASLERLLRRIRFAPGRDRLLPVGDLVNRGPRSLEVLRWAFAHRADLDLVLGNHDLHLLALALGVRVPRKRDTLDAILDAPDRDMLIAWLRQQPLVRRLPGHVVVHAGLLPQWSVEQAEALAREVEAELRGDRADTLLAAYETHDGQAWSDGLSVAERRLLALTAMTRLRVLGPGGRPLLDEVGPPGDRDDAAMPWFCAPRAAWRGLPVVFGHWAALGLHLADGVIGLDSACVWGGRLTALRLDDGQLFQVPCVDGEAVSSW